MRTRHEIDGDTPGEASDGLDSAILRKYSELHLEVLLDIRDLIERRLNETTNPPTPAGRTEETAGCD